MEAIVPSIIVTALVTFFVHIFYFKQLKIKFVNVPWLETFKKSSATLKFGFLLSISSFLTLLANFLVQIFISSTSTLAQVGLFNIGLVVVNQYIGLVFNAMATDYYPQLTRVVDNKSEASAYISKQAIFSMLIITPIIGLFVALAPFLIPLLFASDFLEVVPMVVVLVIAMLFKAASWSFGYVIIAKADTKVLMSSSFIFNLLFVGLCCLGFKQFGLVGIGYAHILYFFLHLVMIQSILYFRYQLRLEWQLYRYFLILLVFCIAIFLTTLLENSVFQMLAQSLVVLLSIFYSIYHINKKTNVLLKIRSFFNKTKN
jgi:PST family polysaccharide transporter